MAQYITINLKKDRIILRVSDKGTQEEIVNALKKKLTELKRLYQNEKTPIFVTGKILKNKEIAEIQDIIKKKIDVDIEFDSPKVLGLHSIRRTYNEDIGHSETKFHKGSLRSGQRIEYEGSLVILGDVNFGAEVMAGENIVVVGVLRGLAHAGAKGNNQAIIAAEKIESPQIRISNVVKELERNEEDYNVRCTYAYLKEEEIIIE